jgi:hypothetical protein
LIEVNRNAASNRIRMQWLFMIGGIHIHDRSAFKRHRKAAEHSPVRHRSSGYDTQHSFGIPESGRSTWEERVAGAGITRPPE